MIGIKGTEMPKRCAKCKACINKKTNDYGSYGECLLQKNKQVNCLVWRRDEKCPLVEIITCKDCKYWQKIKDHHGRCTLFDEVWKGSSLVPIEHGTNEGFYCQMGERS